MLELTLELLSEEIPAGMQTKAADDLNRLATCALSKKGVTFSASEVYATPQRLILVISGLPEETPEKFEERKGPRVDSPEGALQGFLRTNNLSSNDLQMRDLKGVQTWFATIHQKKRPIAELIREVLEAIIWAFPWPKSMRWGAGKLRWVRPLDTIMCILSDGKNAYVVPIEVDGIKASNITRGHRFLAPSPFSVNSFHDYAQKLEAANVIIDPVRRAKIIWSDTSELARSMGWSVVEDPKLLDEVTGLVEWPVALVGEIPGEFLGLPPEVLQTSMREHQKFFSAQAPSGQIEGFITISNISPPDGDDTILLGNQKVLSARLSDAKFFWENDLRTIKSHGIIKLAERLKGVIFHNKLGSQWDRVERIIGLSRTLAPFTGADATMVSEAARIAKADLCSEMVGEFPKLQGVMGTYYARTAKVPSPIANACEAHHSPTGPSDDVPTESVSTTIAIADRIDTLVSFWSVGIKPTGSKDPFALRRATLGLIRIILEKKLHIPLRTIIHDHDPSFSSDELLIFIFDRFEVYLRDRGLRPDIIQACLSLKGMDDLVLMVEHIRALQSFSETSDGLRLLSSYKRLSKILKPEIETGLVEMSTKVLENTGVQKEEIELADLLRKIEYPIKLAFENSDFGTVLYEMEKLGSPIEAFLDNVRVDSRDKVTRDKRIQMLFVAKRQIDKMADWSAIERFKK